jgi:anti-sigma B factor antagonist
MVVDSAGSNSGPATGSRLRVDFIEGVALEKQQIVEFDGRITVDNSNEMREKLGAALKLKPMELTVDMSRVVSIDKSGVATLVEAARRARRQDTRLMITGLQEQPAYLLKVTQMDQLFDIAKEQQKP